MIGIIPVPGIKWNRFTENSEILNQSNCICSVFDAKLPQLSESVVNLTIGLTVVELQWKNHQKMKSICTSKTHAKLANGVNYNLN